MRKLQILSLFLILAFVGIPTVGRGSFVLIEVDAAKMDVPDLEAGDLSDVLDSLLDNITAEIAPAAGIGSGAEAEAPRIVSVGKVLVRASTFDYQVREWIDELDSPNIAVLHNAQPEFLKAYFQASQVLGTYSLKSMVSLASGGMGSSVSSALSTEAINALNAVMGTNDTAAATGFNDDFTEKFSLDDLAADSEVVMNATELIDYGAVEEQYQQFANFTEGNETTSALLGDDVVTDDIRMKTIVSGFDNVQAAVYEILESSIAANYSTPGDQIDPSRVSILEADNDNNNKTTYITKNFADRARAIINNEFFEAESSMSLLGFKLAPMKIVVPASAFFGLKSLSKGFGRIIKMGKTIVSAPFRQASTVVGKIKRTLIDKPINTIRGTITRGMNMGKSIIHKTLNTPSNIIKTIGGQAKSFVQTASKAVTPLVSTAGKLVTKGLSAVGGFMKSLLSMLPLLIFLIAIVGAILLVVYFVFLRPESPTPR